MTIFDIINDVLFKKKGNLLDKKENESDFQPYMLQRWASMYSNLNVRLLNATTNKMNKAMENKPQWYKLFLDTLPKSRYKRIRYIKKVSNGPKGKPDDTEKAIAFIAKQKQISAREVKQYVEDYGLDIKSVVESLKEK